MSDAQLEVLNKGSCGLDVLCQILSDFEDKSSGQCVRNVLAHCAKWLVVAWIIGLVGEGGLQLLPLELHSPSSPVGGLSLLQPLARAASTRSCGGRSCEARGRGTVLAVSLRPGRNEVGVYLKLQLFFGLMFWVWEPPADSRWQDRIEREPNRPERQPWHSRTWEREAKRCAQ